MCRRSALASSEVPGTKVTGNPAQAAASACVQVAAVRSSADCSSRMQFDTGSSATRQIAAWKVSSFADRDRLWPHADGQRPALLGGNLDHGLLQRRVQRLLTAVGGAHERR
jgi:hypothetical protein